MFTALSLALSLSASAASTAPEPAPQSPETQIAEPQAEAPSGLDALSLTLLNGSPLDLDTLRGKTVLFVNVASECGLTPQYEGLQALYEAHKDEGLVIVGTPCNQFGAQEPGSAEEIASFCKMNYGVEFPILEKQEVNGESRSPLYQWLVGSEAGENKDISWNFEKFVVGRDGSVLARFSPRTVPDDPAILQVIREDLARANGPETAPR